MKRTMKRLGRRVFALFLAAAMGLGMMPEMTAQAAENGSTVVKSAFEDATNLDQSDTCYGTITLDGGSVTDSGTPNVWPTGNWEGSVDVTGYSWVHITSTNPDVASASYTTDGGRLSITFTPGTKSGTTKISVGVDAKYPHYSLGTWNMNLNFDYTVTNKTGSTVTPEPGGEKPAPPTDDDVKDFYGYISNRPVAVVVRCVDRNDSLHNGTLQRLAIGSYTIGEVEAYNGGNSDLSTNEWLWMCKVHVDQQYYMDLWSRNFESQRGRHYLVDGQKDVFAPFYYFKGGYCSYAGEDLEEGWYCLTEDAPVYVNITHKAPAVKTYTVRYTDGVAGEIVFADQETKGLSVGAATPAFNEEAGKTETVDENGQNVVRPVRAGYTFEGWSPAINSEVDADDADTKGVITYTATWQKKSGIDDTKITVTKTPSEEYPEVGEEFKYTIEMKNDNDQQVVVTVTDKLNEKLDFVKLSHSDGGVYNPDTHTVTWQNVTIPAYGSKQLLVWVKANAAGEIYNEAKVQWENGSTSGNTTIEAVPPVPTEPEKPTPEEVDELVKGEAKAAVEVYCQPGRHKVGYFDCDKEPGRIQIGEVSNEDGNYTCNVTFIAQKFADGYSALRSKEHKLVEGEGDKTITLHWNAETNTWELAARANTVVVFYVECEEPSTAPSTAPTAEPTVAPTAEPTAEPTVAPTAEPTAEPTAAPTPEPAPGPDADPGPAPGPDVDPGPAPGPDVDPDPAPGPDEEPIPEPEVPVAPPVPAAQNPEPVVPPTPVQGEDDIPDEEVPEGQPAPTATPEPTAAPTATPEPTDAPEDQIVDVEDDTLPLAAPGEGSGRAWALVNLILTILTALMSLLMLTFYFARKRGEDEDMENVEVDEELKRKGLVRLLSILPAVIAVITFILTEDMRNPMILVDKWTLLMLLYAVVNVVLAFFSIKKREVEETVKR